MKGVKQIEVFIIITVIKFEKVVEIVRIIKGKEGIIIMIFIISLNDIKKVLKRKKIWLNKDILDKIFKEFYNLIMLFYKKESD